MKAASIAVQALAFSSSDFAVEAQHDLVIGVVAFIHHESGRMLTLYDQDDSIVWVSAEGFTGRGDDFEATAAVERWMHNAARLDSPPGNILPPCSDVLAELAAQLLN